MNTLEEKAIGSLIEIPEAFEFLFQPARYKVAYGGRGSAKSQSIARALLILAGCKRLRILCTREYQSSIADSVHFLLKDQIEQMSMTAFYTITKTSIVGLNGSTFVFKGLHHNILEIKSTESIDICWIEEAQSVSQASWDILIPTIRKNDSELWLSFNPIDENDPTYQGFVINPRPNSIIKKVNYDENPFFPETLKQEMEWCKGVDFDAYMHIWEGECAHISNAAIFKNRVRIDAFETPYKIDRLFFGADFGFSNDPSTLIRSFIKDECLWIEYEAFGVGVEIDELPQLYDSIPGSRDWPIKADNARPETISYLRRKGFNISAAEKWTGCVEDGIAHLKGFKEIVIHDRCKHVQQEARLYSYKKDSKTGEILPIIVDKHNHGWDATRYSLDGYIMARGAGYNLVRAVTT